MKLALILVLVLFTLQAVMADDDDNLDILGYVFEMVGDFLHIFGIMAGGHLLAFVASSLTENNSSQLAIGGEMANMDTEDHDANSTTDVSSVLLDYLAKVAFLSTVALFLLPLCVRSGLLKDVIFPGVTIGGNHHHHHYHFYPNQVASPPPEAAPARSVPLQPTRAEPSRITRFWQSESPLSEQVHAAVVVLSREALDQNTGTWARHTCDGLKRLSGATFRCDLRTSPGGFEARCDIQCSIFKIETHGVVLFAMVRNVEA
ncbi:hypothetical protein HDE_05640 [Halotydeus destructor]|nr:hypothetical protein HDE_05640 [Halotydeus destructor]